MTTETLEHRPFHLSVNFDRWVDLFSVVLISFATLLTAWCSYQSSSWGNIQAKRYAEAESLRIQASTEQDDANSRTAIDVGLFVQYLSARSAGRNEFSDFLRNHFPPELKQATTEWEATNPERNPSAPNSPFAMPSFKLEPRLRAEEATRAANTAFLSGIQANTHSDDYVLVTVLFASVSFLGGVGGKLRFPFHILLLGFGLLLLLVAGAMLTRLPASPFKPLAAKIEG
ncbi:MAG: hypothetical protein JST54_34945 [Deltaproteobacteria bacterium]|nr:hypothetical protein [Deltaproteobacteria bacterium]